MWCTDDRHPHDIIDEGHIDALVRRAVAGGLPPVTAIRMASLHPAGCFRLPRLGALAPGMRADMVVTKDLDTLPVDQVYAGGRLVAENGGLRPEVELPAPASCPSPMRVDVRGLDFRLPAKGGRAQVIGVVPGQIVTRRDAAAVTERGGFVESDTSADILKIAVIERYRGSGRMGLGLIKGFGLKRGAIASSVAHDSHNIVVVGAEDPDMRAAVSRIVEMGGGLCAASGGSVQAELPLPLAGLMSELPLEAVRQALDRLHAASRKFGCRLDDPFMTLSFMALPVIPELKMTDRGLFDVSRFAHAPLFP
jgi:adenine deaminase